jgi:hypothetical protein
LKNVVQKRKLIKKKFYIRGRHLWTAPQNENRQGENDDFNQSTTKSTPKINIKVLPFVLVEKYH